MPHDVLMLLSNEYRPDPRVLAEADALTEAGYHVSILCWDRNAERPASETQDGIYIKRMRRPVKGPLRTLFLMPRVWLSMWKGSRDLPGRSIHAHDLDTMVPGILIAWSRDAPLIFDAHDWYSRMVKDDLPFSTRLIDLGERLMLKRVDQVITANPTLVRRYQDAGATVTLVLNTPPLPLVKEEVQGPELRLFYGGSLEHGRYILEMMDALAEVDGWKMTVAGYGRLEGQILERAKKDNRIIFMGWISRDRVIEEMQNANVILCPFDIENANHKIATPNRLLESMAAGRAAIATDGSYGGDIVHQEECGLSIPWSEAAFREAVIRLMDPELRGRLAHNGRAAAEREYNWEEMKNRLLEVYSGLGIQ